MLKNEDLNNAINCINNNDFAGAFNSMAEYANIYIHTQFKSENQKDLVLFSGNCIKLLMASKHMNINQNSTDHVKEHVIKAIETLESEDMDSFMRYSEIQKLILKTELGIF